MINKTDKSDANQKSAVYAKEFFSSQICLAYGAVRLESQVAKRGKFVKIGVLGQSLFELIS